VSFVLTPSPETVMVLSNGHRVRAPATMHAVDYAILIRRAGTTGSTTCSSRSTRARSEVRIRTWAVSAAYLTYLHVCPQDARSGIG